MTDRITILRSRGRRLAKLVRASGEIDGYDSARTYDGVAYDIADLDDLAGYLRWLASWPDHCLVRGELIDPNNAKAIRRLVHSDPKTGDAPTLREVPRRYVGLDFDALDRPETVPAHDIRGCAGIALQRLPAAFRGVACIAQATGSHGIAPGIRLRLWYWLDRPLDRRHLDQWLGKIPGLDRSVFRAAQVIYTAAPVFDGQRRDHLPERIVTLPGAACVRVPAITFPRREARPLKPLPKPTDDNAAKYAWAALRNAAARIAATSKGDRHPTVLREACGLSRFVHAKLLNAATIKQVFEDAAQNVGKPEGEAGAVVDWAINHIGGA